MLDLFHTVKKIRKGDSLSPTLFGLFINDLKDVEDLHLGIKIVEEIIYILVKTKLGQLGISGTENKWIRSYLTNRTQIVLINKEQSHIRGITYGVPHVSIFGPLLFSL